MPGIWPDYVLILVGVVGGLAAVGVMVGMVVGGLWSMYLGVRLIPPRTWRRVEAQVERAEVVHDSETVDHVRVYYKFMLDGPSGQPQDYSGDVLPHWPIFVLKRDPEAQAAGIRAAGTISIWYAEELPSLRYSSRPYWAWQVTKGLAAIAAGLLLIAGPVFFLKPGWFGVR